MTAVTGISVCIATYQRADRLAALLTDLTRQTLLPGEVVVVDNDAAESARPVVVSDTLKPLLELV